VHAALHIPTPFRSPRRSARALRGLLCGITALASACASYPARTAAALEDFRAGRFEPAIEAFADVDEEFLAGAEAGTVALTAGDWDAALRHLHRADRAVEAIEDRALVGVESFSELVGSWALNDTARAYPGEGFERVYLHAQLAMAYLARGELEDVLVEVKRANRLLEAEEELYEKDYRAGGLGHLISALTYELLGESDQAYVDYLRMAEKGVGVELAGRALVRLAAGLGREDDLARWVERYGPDLERPDGAASIVVLAGVGLGPVKDEGRLVLPTPDGLIPFAVPSYGRRPQPVSRLRLALEGSGESVLSDVLESVSDVAEENLEDRLLWTAAKSVGRGVLKRQLTKHLQDEYGLGGRVLGDVFAVVSERADLRGWTTLPDTWQALRMFVPPGVHELVLDAVEGGSLPLGSFALEPGETMVILARTLGARLYAHPLGGRPVPRPSLSVEDAPRP
jgi:hypothetical protein